ncbi:MAG: response regulator [Chloroflexi bacterium]|nr:response regulator [Chloroflexota bacterium]
MDSNNTTPFQPNTPLRILLVEDSEHDVMAFRRAFTRNQVTSEITHYMRAEDVIDQLRTDTASFDLVVTDYKLPGMTGLDLCRELLARQVPIPLVLLTGAGTEHLAVEALKTGVDEYMVKDPDQGYLDLLPLVLPDVVQKHDDRRARHRAEVALRESEYLLTDVFESIQDGISVLDTNLTIRRVNGVMKHWYQAHLPLEGKKCYECYHNRDKACEHCPTLRCLESGKPESQVVPGFPGSSIEWLELFSFPMRDHDSGIITGVVEYVRDITERKRAEQALRQRTIELESRNEELDTFAHTVAHDLKNPLSLIMGYVEVIQADYATEQRDRVLDGHLNMIAQSALKMSHIIDALMLLAGARKVQIVPKPLDMASIVKEVMKRSILLIEEHQAEITFSDIWPVVMGHGPWVEEVWVNYLSNAIKYGGRPPRVELGFETPQDRQGGTDSMVRFWVRDNGAGISSEAQTRLFTPFTRLDQTHVTGHGLGLSIVRRIVERLGGQVSVKSQVGQGSTFIFSLPVVRDVFP